MVVICQPSARHKIIKSKRVKMILGVGKCITSECFRQSKDDFHNFQVQKWNNWNSREKKRFGIIELYFIQKVSKIVGKTDFQNEKGNCSPKIISHGWAPINSPRAPRKEPNDLPEFTGSIRLKFVEMFLFWGLFQGLGRFQVGPMWALCCKSWFQNFL